MGAGQANYSIPIWVQFLETGDLGFLTTHHIGRLGLRDTCDDLNI